MVGRNSIDCKKSVINEKTYGSQRSFFFFHPSEITICEFVIMQITNKALLRGARCHTLLRPPDG